MNRDSLPRADALRSMGPDIDWAHFAETLVQFRPDNRVTQEGCRLPGAGGGFVGRGMPRASVRAKGHNDKSMGTAFIGDKDGSCRIAV